MADERDPSAIVPLMLRIREDLRHDLEESAKSRRVSLNQEAIDRLSYVRDRKSLLAEVLRLSFGDRLAGLLLALGFAMSNSATGHRRYLSGRVTSPSEWIDHPAAFNRVAETANALLLAARPDGEEVRHKPAGPAMIDQVLQRIISDQKLDDPEFFPAPMLMPKLPAREADAAKELLGPVDDRIRAVLAVRDAMVRSIVSGKWKPNSPIPSESDLARELRVNTETIRKAIDLLEHEGVLTRRAAEASDPVFAVNRSEQASEVHRDSATGEIRKGPPPSMSLDQKAAVKPGARIKSQAAHRGAGIPSKRIER